MRQIAAALALASALCTLSNGVCKSQRERELLFPSYSGRSWQYEKITQHQINLTKPKIYIDQIFQEEVFLAKNSLV